MADKLMPHEELFKICKKAAGDSVWALEMTANEEGKLIWWVYCSDPKKMKKIPKTFKGQQITTILCQKPGVSTKTN